MTLVSLILMVLFSTPLLATAGRMTTQIKIPNGVMIKSFHAQYNSGGLDSCQRRPRILGQFKIVGDVFTGSVDLKETIRDQFCLKDLVAVVIGYEIFDTIDNVINFDGKLQANPLIIPSESFTYKISIPVKKNVPAMGVKGFLVDCSEILYDWQGASCKHDTLPPISMAATDNFLAIDAIKVHGFTYPSAAPVQILEVAELGFGLELYQNEGGALGKRSPVRIYQIPGAIKSVFPPGVFRISRVYDMDGSLIITFGGALMNTRTAHQMQIDLNKLPHHRSVEECKLSDGSCNWDVQINNYRKDSGSTDVFYKMMSR